MSTDWKKVAIKFFRRFSPSSSNAINRVSTRQRFFFYMFTLFIWEADILYKLIFSNHKPAQICTQNVFILFYFFCVAPYHNSFRRKLNFVNNHKMFICPKRKQTIKVDRMHKRWLMKLFIFPSFYFPYKVLQISWQINIL